MTAPLFRRPRTIVFLDDDAEFLRMLALTVPRHWHTRFFTQPQNCVDQLRGELPRYKADVWLQQSMVTRWHRERREPLPTQLLRYWSGDTSRYELSGVLVIDYAMPGKNGLEVLRELDGWPGARILLTGRGDAQLGVEAFNEGLIDRFIEKQTPDLAALLVRSVQHLHDTAIGRLAGIWRATLSAQQQAALCMPGMSERLHKAAQRNGWVEYVTLGEPFGMLGLRSDGQAAWQPLEITEDPHEPVRASVTGPNPLEQPDMAGGYSAFLARRTERRIEG